MENTPLAFRTHVTIFGNTNAGKSALFNKLIGQDMAIVSPVSGTTTDPVTKAIELLPYGPVALTDTAGLGDFSVIGAKRMKKTKKLLDRTDYALYAADSTNFDETAYLTARKEFNELHIPHLLIFTKSDLPGQTALYPDAPRVSTEDPASVARLKTRLIDELGKLKPQEETMVGNLLPAGSTVLLIIPIDSEAPKGRLILPQVQLLRDCLDHGIKCVVCRDTELEDTLREYPRIDLAVTDSQVFAFADRIVPSEIKLTSFSMLMANMKCGLQEFIQGTEAVNRLKDGSRVLMAEACTHNASHEDIGRVKIPNLLKKRTGKDLHFDFYAYHDFPADLKKYDLVVHCGGCMINARSMQNRVEFCKKAGVPITNYGVVLAYASGILNRAKQIFI